MNKTYLIKLDELKKCKRMLTKQINIFFVRNKTRDYLFEQLNEVNNEIKKLEFKIRMERELKKNENSNSN